MSIGKIHLLHTLFGEIDSPEKSNILCAHYDIIKIVYYYENHLFKLNKKFK